MDPNADSPQAETSQEEHIDEQPTNLIATNLKAATDLRAAPCNLDETINEDQLQSSKMRIKEGQQQEESIMNPTATPMQNRNSLSDQLTARQQNACQPTLRSMESSTYCMNERGNLENNISIHEPRSQGPRTLLVVLTEATNGVARTPARQFCSTADT